MGEWYLHALWVLAAGAIGFAVAAVFSSRLHLPRAWFLVPHAVASGGLVYGYLAWSRLDSAALLGRNWLWGLLGALAIGAFLVRNILSQPPSARARGLPLVLDLVWSGVVYGVADALLLSVLPVLATWEAGGILGLTDAWPGRILVGVLAFAASLLVTAAYHLGFTEYRVAGVRAPLVGNGVMSLGYLVTTNPATCVLSHAAMHVAAVLRGPATMAQLPPHYRRGP